MMFQGINDRLMKKRRFSLDLIRVFAVILVIFDHTGENGFELYWRAKDIGLQYFLMMFTVFSNGAVFLFFMISGAVLLGRDESIREVFTKRILRYIAIIVLFSFMYYVRLYIKNPEYGFSIKFFLQYIYERPFITPYWFLYSYLGFLVVLPILRAIAKSLDESGYLLLIGTTMALKFLVIPERILNFEHINFTIGFTESFIIYPLIGYAIVNVFSDRLFCIKTKIMGIVLFVTSLLSSLWLSIIDYDSVSKGSQHVIGIFNFCTTILFFYFIICIFDKGNIKVNSKVEEIIEYIGSCSFCIYLFEDMLRSDIFLKIFSVTGSDYVKLLLCIPYIICMMASGILISTILRHVPGVNKLGI